MYETHSRHRPRLLFLTPITVHASTVPGFRTWFPFGAIVRN